MTVLWLSSLPDTNPSSPHRNRHRAYCRLSSWGCSWCWLGNRRLSWQGSRLPGGRRTASRPPSAYPYPWRSPSLLRRTLLEQGNNKALVVKNSSSFEYLIKIFFQSNIFRVYIYKLITLPYIYYLVWEKRC